MTRTTSAVALDRLMAVINERTTIEPRHRPAIRASLRAYRRAIEAEAAAPAALGVVLEALRVNLFPRGFDHPEHWSLTNVGAKAIAWAARLASPEGVEQE